MNSSKDDRELLRQEQKLLRDYEEKYHHATDPREISKCQSEIHRCKEQICKLEDEIWRPVEKELSRIEGDITNEALQPLLNQAKVLSERRRGEPELIDVLLRTIRQIQHMVEQEEDILEAIEKIIAGEPPIDWIFPPGLREKYDILHPNLINIIQLNLEAIEAGSTTKRLPIVFLVMTRKQAQDLAEGKTSLEHPACPEFKDFRDIIAKTYASNWVEQYDEKPELWKPFVDSGETIQSFIEKIFQKISDEQIRPEILSIHALNEAASRERLVSLRRRGCIVIMDIVSMRHPEIQCQFKKSILDAFPNTIVATFNPTGDGSILRHKMYSSIEEYTEMEWYKRRHTDGDRKCETVQKFADLRRLLYDDLIKELVSIKDKKRQGVTRHWYRIYEGK